MFFFVCFLRHRSEISKIPMYADSILKMLKDIRKAVRTSIKLQSDSSVFAQFLEEVRFGTHEIVFTEAVSYTHLTLPTKA